MFIYNSLSSFYILKMADILERFVGIMRFCSMGRTKVKNLSLNDLEKKYILLSKLEFLNTILT